MAGTHRAMLAGYDKTGIGDLAQALHDLGWQIISTGGTAAAVRAAGVPVTEVADLTGSPEMFNGRVKTLHPIVHGGILYRRGIDDADAERYGIPNIEHDADGPEDDARGAPGGVLGVGQRVDHPEELDDRTRPAVRDHQRHRPRRALDLGARLADEVQALRTDIDEVVGIAVDPLLAALPVVAMPPVFDQFGEEIRIGAGRPATIVGDRRLPRIGADEDRIAGRRERREGERHGPYATLHLKEQVSRRRVPWPRSGCA